MKSLKKLTLFLMLVFMALGGCATTGQAVEGSVNPKIKNIYLSSVTIENTNGRSYGSGTIIHNKAGQQMFVLTAAHVVKAIQEKKEKIAFTTGYDSIRRETKVYKIDNKCDLAIIYTEKFEKKSGPYIDISLYSPNIGDNVLVIGAPLGADRTVTNGIISNFVIHEGKVLYRTTAATFYGNSGGGLFNSDGKLIGVVHEVLEVKTSVFSSQLVPGGFFFVGLESIRKFM